MTGAGRVERSTEGDRRTHVVVLTRDSPPQTYPRPTNDTPDTGDANVPLTLNNTLTLLMATYWLLGGGGTPPVLLYHRYSSWVVEL